MVMIEQLIILNYMSDYKTIQILQHIFYDLLRFSLTQNIATQVNISYISEFIVTLLPIEEIFIKLLLEIVSTLNSS